MKYLILNFIFIISPTDYGQLINVTVDIFNHSGEKFTKGILVVDGKVEIIFDKEGVHTIQLEKGSHEFRFKTEELQAVINAPEKISVNKNEIKVLLFSKKDNVKSNLISKEDSFEKIAALHQKGELKFLEYGLGAQMDDKMRDFTKKYGIHFSIEGCVVHDTENNHLVAVFLDKKFGAEWRQELNHLPLGVDKLD